mmetsp:Transcript_26804/g.68908  ORF Transcript_26804/g.68908 Transcript_26804/m.68908 type:complete len:856 (-) Transcript_26804:278-2845(-)
MDTSLEKRGRQKSNLRVHRAYSEAIILREDGRDRLSAAVACLRDGIAGREMDVKLAQPYLTVHAILHGSKWMVVLRVVLTLLFLGLGVFEEPSWCALIGIDGKNISSTSPFYNITSCSGGGMDKFYTSGVPYLPLLPAHLIELFCVLFFLAETVLRHWMRDWQHARLVTAREVLQKEGQKVVGEDIIVEWEGGINKSTAAIEEQLSEMEDMISDSKRLSRRRRWRLVVRYRWELSKVVILSLDLLLLLLAFVCLFSDVCVAGLLTFRGVLRPLFVVCYYRRLRNAFSNIFKTIPDFFDILFLLVIVLVIFSWVGLLLFNGTAEGDEYFPDLGMSMMNLHILITTANYPDVMMPIYNEYRYASIFFIIFLVVALFFLMNLILAVIYNNYKVHHEHELEKKVKYRHKAFHKAFIMLDVGKRGEIKFATFSKVFRLIRPDVTEQQAEAICHIMDASNEGTITLKEFQDLYLVLQLKFSRIDQATRCSVGVERRCFRCCRGLRRIVFSKVFEAVVYVLILANAVVLGFETSDVLDNSYDSKAWFPAELVFIVLFLIEQILKIIAFGLRRYWKDNWNKFDGFIVLVSTIAFIYFNAGMVETGNTPTVRLALLFRVFRLFRLLSNMERYQVIFSTLGQLVPHFFTFLCVQLVVMYIFATLGVQLFGGLVYAGNPNLTATNYVAGPDGYLPNNFNDFAGALVTLFELLIVNNWFLIMNGFVAVTSNWSRIFFIAFWVCGVVIALNLLVAFVLDVFITAWEKNQKRKQKERAKRKSLKVTGYLGEALSEKREEDEVDDESRSHASSVTEQVLGLTKEEEEDLLDDMDEAEWKRLRQSETVRKLLKGLSLTRKGGDSVVYAAMQ